MKRFLFLTVAILSVVGSVSLHGMKGMPDQELVKATLKPSGANGRVSLNYVDKRITEIVDERQEWITPTEEKLVRTAQYDKEEISILDYLPGGANAVVKAYSPIEIQSDAGYVYGDSPKIKSNKNLLTLFRTTVKGVEDKQTKIKKLQKYRKSYETQEEFDCMVASATKEIDTEISEKKDKLLDQKIEMVVAGIPTMDEVLVAVLRKRDDARLKKNNEMLLLCAGLYNTLSK